MLHGRGARLRPRRDFLAMGAAAAGLSGAAGRGLWAAAEEGAIAPGFFASQFYDRQEKEALGRVVDTGSPFRYWGPSPPRFVEDFEEAFARHMGVRYALAVTSGTAALDCAVAALGIGPGDEVIVPAYTWWSDYTCVVHAGALPVFADIDASLCLDPEDFARRITPRTRAVIAVHLLGGPCDMQPIMDVARAKGVAVIEDAAQCVGGAYKGTRLGGIGDVGIYSFQLNKMISSGEGGALVTNDATLYERAARFHDMGGMQRVFLRRVGESRVPEFPGENFRMSEFTGAVLGAQLPKLDTMIAGLRGVAQAVREGIADLPGLRLRARPDPEGDLGYGVYLEMEDRQQRDRCIARLREQGIPAGTMSGSVMLPVQRSVMEKRARHAAWPSFTSPEGRAVQYGPECCRRTLGVFDRFVEIRMGPKYTERMVARIVAAVRGTYASL